MSDPLIEIAIEPKTKADQKKTGIALVRLAQEDPSFRVTTDTESGQTILGGMSEDHLAKIIERLRSEFGVDGNVGAPQVAYRETITRAADVDYTHRRQTGSSGQFARVKLHFEPLPRGFGFQFENKVVGAFPHGAYVPGVEKGVSGSLNSGVLAGFPVIDLTVELVDGVYHEVDSSALTFEIAARAATKEGLAKASPVLLEPIMKIEVVTPLDCAREVLGDLRTRRSTIERHDWRSDTLGIAAIAPLANLFGHSTSLASLTGGRGSFTMAFSHYAPVPLPSPGDDPFRPAMGMRA